MKLPQKFCQNILIYGTALISVMGIASIFPVLPNIASDLNLDESMLGVLIYSFTLPGIFFAPIGGILADRFGRKAVLLSCLFLFAIGGFISSFATTLSFLIFWRVIQGIGAACLGVLYTTIVGDLYKDEDTRLKIMAYASTTLSLGAAIFPAIGGLLGQIEWTFSLRLSLLSIPLICIGLFTKLPKPKKHGNMLTYAKDSKAIILQRQCLLRFAITFCAFCILYGPLISFFPLISSTYYQASPLHIGLLFSLSSLGTVIATLVLAPIVKLFSQKIIACLGALFFIMAMLILWLWPQSLSYWWLLMPIFFYGLGQGLLYPIIITSLSALAPTTKRGVLMAINGTILRLSQSIAPFACGLIFIYASFSGVFLFGLIMGVTMFILTFFAFPLKKED